MASTDSGYKKSPVCKTGARILYAWAMDAPPLKLPEGRTGVHRDLIENDTCDNLIYAFI
mgnify:CR=1 FL=1